MIEQRRVVRGHQPEGDGESAATVTPSASEGDLVVVQQSVLATVDHAFGNLFQRVYYLLRAARDNSGHTLPAVEESIRELQGLLELFVDYVAPTPIETRPLRCSDLVTSFRQRLGEELGPASAPSEEPELSCAPEAKVAADPARLARAFQLLARTARGLIENTVVVRSSCRLSSDRSQLEIVLEHLPRLATADAELRWALARKLVELQGGDLDEAPSAGGARWMLRLPVVYP